MVVINHNIKFILSLLFLSLLYTNDSYIDVITTNDMHGFLNEQDALFMNPNFPPKIMGGAAFIEYVNKIKVKLSSGLDDMLILDGGNFFQGHPVGIVDSGKTMIEWMNKVGYDAIVPAQNDFLFGYENLVSLSEKANFPFLAANIFNYEGENIFDPYTILNIKDVKIGIIGIAGDVIVESVLDKNLRGVTISSSADAMKKWVSKLEKMDIDIIVVLTSAGVPWDRDVVYKEFVIDTLDIKNGQDIGDFTRPDIRYDCVIHLAAFADIRNGSIGGRAGSSNSAASFLEFFVPNRNFEADGNKIPWVHLDIAGTAWGPGSKAKSEGINPLFQYGVSGVHVRTLFELINSE